MKGACLFIAFSLFPLMSFAQAQPDDERLIRALEERGVICQGLTYAEKQEALRIYLSRKASLNNQKQKVKDTTKHSDLSETEKVECISPE
nr:hypothetical protein [Photobacterium sp. GJ3]